MNGTKGRPRTRRYDYDAVARFIARFRADNGRAPTDMEIAIEFRMPSPAAARTVVEGLALEGRLRIVPPQPRDLIVLQPGASA